MSNTFHFTGRLAEAPSLKQHGETKVAKFVLIRNQYAGKDAAGERKENVVSIQFTAFNGTAEAIAENVRKGDQLIVSASITNNNYESEGELVYGYNFKIEDFDFGAPGAETREVLAKRRTK